MSQSWIMKEELRNCYKLFDFSLMLFSDIPMNFCACAIEKSIFDASKRDWKLIFDWRRLIAFFLFKLKILFFPQLDLESREWINIAPPMKRSLTSKLFFFLLFIFNFNFPSSIARLASSSSSSFSSSTTHYCSDLSSERVLNTTQKTD